VLFEEGLLNQKIGDLDGISLQHIYVKIYFDVIKDASKEVCKSSHIPRVLHMAKKRIPYNKLEILTL
jgi:hypothetical protein